MRSRNLALSPLVAALMLVAGPVIAAPVSAPAYQVPLTPFGQPDMPMPPVGNQGEGGEP